MKRLVLAAFVACGYEAATRTITAADVGNVEATRVTSYLSAPARAGNPTETAPGSIDHTALADDASILQARNDEVCFALTTRNAADIDAPFDQMHITFDGVDVHLKDERVTVKDYPESGGAPQTIVEDLERSDWERLPREKPAAHSLRVYERRGKGCAKMAGLPSELTLELSIPKSDGKGDFGEKFVWKMLKK